MQHPVVVAVYSVPFDPPVSRKNLLNLDYDSHAILVLGVDLLNNVKLAPLR